MKTFNNMKDLKEAILVQVENALKKEVAEEIKLTESIAVESVVYGGYKPNTPDGQPYVYQRRGDNGLANMDNMIEKTETTPNGVKLTITNENEGEGGLKGLADLVEGGDGAGGKRYTHRRNRETDSPDYLKPRPFQAKAVSEMNSTGSHYDSFEQGMERRGITVKKR